MIRLPDAHAQALLERGREMAELARALNLMQNEEKRHMDAVLRSLDHDPEECKNRSIISRNGSYYLEIADIAPEEAKKEETAWARG